MWTEVHQRIFLCCHKSRARNEPVHRVWFRTGLRSRTTRNDTVFCATMNFVWNISFPLNLIEKVIKWHKGSGLHIYPHVKKIIKYYNKICIHVDKLWWSEEKFKSSDLIGLVLAFKCFLCIMYTRLRILCFYLL